MKIVFSKKDYQVVETSIEDIPTLNFKPSSRGRGKVAIISFITSRPEIYVLPAVLLVKKGFEVILPRISPTNSLMKYLKRLNTVARHHAPDYSIVHGVYIGRVSTNLDIVINPILSVDIFLKSVEDTYTITVNLPIRVDNLLQEILNYNLIEKIGHAISSEKRVTVFKELNIKDLNSWLNIISLIRS